MGWPKSHLSPPGPGHQENRCATIRRAAEQSPRLRSALAPAFQAARARRERESPIPHSPHTHTEAESAGSLGRRAAPHPPHRVPSTRPLPPDSGGSQHCIDRASTGCRQPMQGQAAWTTVGHTQCRMHFHLPAGPGEQALHPLRCCGRAPGLARTAPPAWDAGVRGQRESFSCRRRVVCSRRHSSSELEHLAGGIPPRGRY